MQALSLLSEAEGQLLMDDTDYALSSSAFGILRCLRALAEEAAALNLHRTLSAIEDALEAAAGESGVGGIDEQYAGALPPPIVH